MLILPPGHHREVTQRRVIAGRERWVVAGMAALVAALVAAVVFAVAGGGATHVGKGCLNVTIDSSLGGEQLVRCGENARQTCATIDTSQGYTGLAGRDIAADCRRLHLPVG